MTFTKFYFLNLREKFGKIQVRVDKSFLKKLIVTAAKDNKPHINKNFMKKLEIKPNLTYGRNITIYGWGRYTDSIPIKKMIKIMNILNYSYSNIEKKVISLKGGSRGGEVNIKFPINIDKRLGCIIGHILGDGSIDSNYKQVFFSNSNKELLKEFESKMFSIFNVKPRIWMQRKSNFGKTRWEKRLEKIDYLKKNRNCGLFYTTICGVILNEIFDGFCIGKNKKITQRIKTASKEFKIGLIRAFYDDEGNVGKDRIRLFQDNKGILISISKFLKEMGIKPGSIKRYKKRGKFRHYFDIYRKSNFIRFKDKIGFTSTAKMGDLKEISIIKNFYISK